MKEKARVFLKFMKLLAPYRRRWFFILAASGLGALAAASAPYLSRFVVDEGLLRRDKKAFLVNLGLAAGLFLSSEIFKALRHLLDAHVRGRFHFDLNKKVFEHIQYLSLGWFKERSTGENVYKLDYDVMAVTDFITQAVPQVLFILLEGAVVIVVLLHLNWRLSCLAFALALGAYGPSAFLGRRMARLCQSLVKNAEEVFGFLEEHFSRILLIKVFAKEKRAARGLAHRLADLLRATLAHARWEAATVFASEAAGKIIVGVISLVGGYQVINGRMSVGVLTAVIAYLYQLVALYGQVVPFVENTSVGFVSCRRLDSILGEPREDREMTACAAAQPAPLIGGHIVFRQASFGYLPGRDLLKNISLDIEAGAHVALTGPSGCGKTTFLSLLVRLYELREGDIVIDGLFVRDMSLASLREQIGFALQEPLLWNDTVAHNIGYGRKDATEDEVLWAGRVSLVDEFVEGLRDGYHTVIGENACKLSEGQKQKIAIARALIKRPKILILDEAMASMDSAGEERILANIKKDCAPLTLIVVSHRLSAVKAADLVYYLVSPGEVLVDTPENFLKHNESFVRLFAGQTEESV